MSIIINIKSQFRTREVYNVYALCMYMPTWEKFCGQADEFVSNDLVHIFGFSEYDCLLGLIVIELYKDTSAEIKGIAVDPLHRHQGIGRQLIRYAFDHLPVSNFTR